MKFAHLADCHIGSWRDPNLRDLGIKSFDRAIDICLKENVAFILISGDLFNTSLPSIEIIKDTAAILQRLRENDISVYIIPGSHDYSPSNKTMLDVLEKAGLVDNVTKFQEINGKINLEFTLDKTNTKLTGIYGKRAGLDRFVYKNLDKNPLEKESGFKIFMFHCGINEFKTMAFEKLDFESIKDFPKNFDYYAGGHIHYIYDKKVPEYGLFVYPGPLFPNNFEEIETLKCGHFVMVNVDNQKNITLKRIELNLKDTACFDINVDDLDPANAYNKIISNIETKNIEDKIVTLRVHGILSSGKVSDINFKEIYSLLGLAYSILKNTNKLTTKEYEEVKSDSNSLNDVEQSIIESTLGNLKLEGISDKEETFLINDLIHNLSLEKQDSEKTAEFESRIIDNMLKILKSHNLIK